MKNGKGGDCGLKGLCFALCCQKCRIKPAVVFVGVKNIQMLFPEFLPKNMFHILIAESVHVQRVLAYAMVPGGEASVALCTVQV